jgi:hypothetical protein
MLSRILLSVIMLSVILHSSECCYAKSHGTLHGVLTPKYYTKLKMMYLSSLLYQTVTAKEEQL